MMDGIIFIIFEADSQDITWWAMCLRAIMVFFLAIALINIAGKRMFSKQGAFDIVTSIMLGTLLARSITGNSKFIPTLITCLLLALLHRILAKATFANHKLGRFLKGRAYILIKDGVIQQDNIKKHSVTEKDLIEAVRLEGKISSISEVKEAYLERSGKISIIPIRK